MGWYDTWGVAWDSGGGRCACLSVEACTRWVVSGRAGWPRRRAARRSASAPRRAPRAPRRSAAAVGRALVGGDEERDVVVAVDGGARARPPDPLQKTPPPPQNEAGLARPPRACARHAASPLAARPHHDA